MIFLDSQKQFCVVMMDSMAGRLLLGGGAVVWLLVCEQRGGRLVGAGEIAAGSHVPEALLASGAADDTGWATAGLKGELDGLSTFTSVELVGSFLSGHPDADVIEEGHKLGKATAPIPANGLGGLSVFANDEAMAARGHQAESTATGFSAAVAETGRPAEGTCGSHVGNEFCVRLFVCFCGGLGCFLVGKWSCCTLFTQKARVKKLVCGDRRNGVFVVSRNNYCYS